MDSATTPRLHALLIGVNRYHPGTVRGSRYLNLGGAVGDIDDVESFLRRRHRLTDERLIRLTATVDPANPDGPPIEPPDVLPTYENMVGAFRRLADVVERGDRVYVHYAGHGGRTPTLIPDDKGGNAHDEALVPTNIGDPSARYLRDVELADLLDELVARGAALTVVLDCCHSGGALRFWEGPTETDVRGTGLVDYTPRSRESRVEDPAVLSDHWRRLQTRRGAGFLGSGWLPEARGYVLIAACRSTEQAYEREVDGVGKRGVLTRALLEVLERAGERTTYRDVYERILALVHGRAEYQTPVIEGEGNRLLLGTQHVPAPYTARVMRVEGDRLVLDVGAVDGFGAGAKFDLYPPGTRGFRPSRRLATATLAEPGTTESWAALDGAPSGEIVPGTLAVPRSPGIRLAGRVRIVRDGADAAGLQALDYAAREIARNGWVEETPVGERDDWQLAVNAAGEFEVRDPGGVPVPNLRPALMASAPGSPGRVVRRLAHLARWRAVRDVENADRNCLITGKVRVERFVPGAEPAFVPASRVRARPGEEIVLRAINASSDELNVAALLLQPTWAIEQVHPLTRGSYFDTLAVGDPRAFAVRVALPHGETRGEAVLKVFATTGAPNFRVLQLPALDRPPNPERQPGGGPEDPLQALLDAMAADQPAVRALTPSPYAGLGWTVVTVPIEIAPEADA
jgi:hypothetical protein